MSYDTNAIVKAVQESVKNLLELVEQATRGRSAEEIEGLKEEARKTVFMMIAAIVLADEKYADGERAFLNLLVDWSQKPGGEMRYLNEYAGAWKTACIQVPRFFQAGVDHDRRVHTELARGMIREMELIGNNTCVSDGQFEATEHEVVRKYMVLLEEFLAAGSAQQGALKDNAADGWTSV
jgi:tellurite resistance protein